MKIVLPLCALLTVGSLCVLAKAAIEIRLDKRVLMAGQSIWLTCRVEPDARNRLLQYGIAELADSQRDLNAFSPITFPPVEYKDVTCGVGPAYCAVIRNDRSFERAVQSFTIANCEP